MSAAEVIKRRFKGLHQITKLINQEIQDEYVQFEEGLDVIHPGMANVSKKDLGTKLASMYKLHDSQCIQLFGFKTAFGGGRSTGFGLIYESLDKMKKFEPKYRLKDKKGAGRRSKKDTKNRHKKVRGKDKTRLLYTSPSPRDRTRSRMPSSA